MVSGVPETAMKSLPAGFGRDDLPITIAQMPISEREGRIAFVIMGGLAFIDAIAIPFGDIPLARIDNFIPVLQTLMCFIDLVTAALLFAQYSINPGRAMLAVASGYCFGGVFAFLQTLAFPGAYSSTAVIGDGINSAAWFFVLWQTTFPLCLVLYAVAKDGKRVVAGSITTHIVSTIAVVIAATAALSWLAIEGASYLPPLYVNATQQTLIARYFNFFLWALNVTTFVLLFVRRRTVLDFWLMVVLFAWWPNFAVASFYVVVRFGAGWYLGRVIALMASSTLLVVLLVESVALYGRLTTAYLLLRRERTGRLMSVEEAASAIIHEVSQPLTGVETYSSAALRWLSKASSQPELQKVHDCLVSVRTASHRAEEILGSLRRLFRSTDTAATRCQLNDIVRETLNLVRNDLVAGGVTVTTQYEGNLPQLKIDRTQIQQVMFNLIRNAIDAMHNVSSGKRSLRIATSFDGKSRVAVYIKDSGPGVPLEHQDDIFEPFFTTKPNGTGLGLSICRTIVERHGGALQLAKTNTRGSSFEVLLPIDSSMVTPEGAGHQTQA